MTTAVEIMKALYVRGTNAGTDDATLLQLRAQAAELDVAIAESSAAALAEIRRTSGWHALLLSPALPQNETLALIASLRRDRVPIAIVPIIDEVHQDLFASAVASGADDVLLRRGQTLLNVAETLTRIRQSPHLFPAEQRRRITVLYAGRDALVWNLLEQVPFVKAEKVQIGPDGTCPVREADAPNGSLLCDAVVIDEQPGDAHPLQVLKSVKAQASDLPVVVLSSTATGDIATAALELGADDTVQKSGIFRRRLIATLRRVHQRLEITTQQAEIKAREERLRHIVETVPTGITIIGGDGAILAMNAAALRLFGAKKPRDVVGRDFRQLVSTADHDRVAAFIQHAATGHPASAVFTGLTLEGAEAALRVDGVVLERDARGGRGVVVAIGPVGTGTAEEVVSSPEELAGLRDALERTERHYAELEDIRARERASWEDERRMLEARLEAAEGLATERDALGARLHEVSAELREVNETFVREREALEARLKALEATAAAQASAGLLHTDLEGTLESVREELRQAVTAHALERSDWQAMREDLEVRLRDLDAAREAQATEVAGVEGLKAEVDEFRTALERERQAAAEQQGHLDHELRSAREALWAEHGDRDAMRLSFERELGMLRQTIGIERQTWAETQATLEHDAQQAREQLAAHARELAAAQAERDDAQQRAVAAIDGERHDWNTTRARLEDDTRAARDRIAGLESELAAVRSHLDAQQAGVRDAIDAERRAWEAERVALHQELNQARDGAEHAYREVEARLAAVAADLDAARARAATTQQDLEAAQHAHNAARDAWQQQLETGLREADAARARLEEDLLAARASHDAARQIWDSLRSSLEDDLHRTRDLLTMGQNDWDAAQATQATELGRIRERAEAVERERDAMRDALEAERTQWQHAQMAIDEERQQTHATFDSERQAWDAARDALDEQLRHAQARADAIDRELADERQRAAQMLDETRGQLLASFEGERQHWMTAQSQLDDQLRQARGAIDDLQQQLDVERQRVEATLETERHAWQQTRAHLESSLESASAASQASNDQRIVLEGLLRRAHEDVDSLQRELDATQSQLEQDREHVRTSTERERAEWDAVRTELETALQAADRVREDLATKLQITTEARDAAEALLVEAETLEVALEAARAEIRHTDEAHASERARWQAERETLETQQREQHAACQALEARLIEAGHLQQERQRLTDALDALRADYATMVHTLAAEKAERDRAQREVDALRMTLAEAQARHAELDRQVAEAARAAEDRLARLDAQHAARVRDLEQELIHGAQRLARVSDEATAARVALQAEYLQAAEGHSRLVSSDLFGYAVMTLPGELVRCNDAFARLFGFEDAPDALTRTAGRLFPGLSGRTALAARLTAEGHVEQIESCLERVDGQPVRIVESATLLADPNHSDDEMLVEHLVIGTGAAPTADELQARRLEEVGALATAMVPEIEALVATAHERGHELRRQLRDAAAGGGDIDTMLTLTAQINALVRQLATFSRRQVRDAASVDLADAIKRTEPVLVRLVGDYIGFSLRLAPTPPVLLLPEDLDQLLTSLVTFCRDLLPAGGSLVVETRGPASGDTPMDADGQAASSATILSVTASGYGVQLPADAAPVELVAQRCGGRLRLSGEAGWMARVDVLFPRCGGVRQTSWPWLTDGH